MNFGNFLIHCRSFVMPINQSAFKWEMHTVCVLLNEDRWCVCFLFLFFSLQLVGWNRNTSAQRNERKNNESVNRFEWSSYIYKIFAMIVVYVQLWLVLQHTTNSSTHSLTRRDLKEQRERFACSFTYAPHCGRGLRRHRHHHHRQNKWNRREYKKNANCLDCDVASVLATLHWVRALSIVLLLFHFFDCCCYRFLCVVSFFSFFVV